ncbi:MAG: class I SAM-dependent methyltransferase [Gammaproteobacteria bacterium]|nr:class I SAM-dependent methyltransferase [Gammaproteobacteria bacterium]
MCKDKQVKDSSYVLTEGREAKARLDLLHQLCGDSTLSFYRKAGLKAGMRALDVGCGIGNTSIDIARVVGSEGQVAAIDISEKQIEEARLNAEAHQISNISFLVRDAGDIADLGKFDFVCSRFLLIHLKEPMSALKAMYDALLKGGVLACEEPHWSDFFSTPPSEAIRSLIQWQLSYCEQVGINFELGKELCGMLEALKCCSIVETTFQPVIREPSPMKRMLAMFATEAAGKYERYRIATREEINTVVQQLESYACDPETCFGASKQHQVYGLRC